jgi:hypothetical protein
MKGFIASVTGRERLAAIIWLVVSAVVGNTIYDLMITRAVKDYMFRVALFEAGRGPRPPLRLLMEQSVYDATWVGLLFGSIVALAGFATIRLLAPHRS